MKYCPECKQTKSLEEFYKKARYKLYPDSPAGRDGFCKECRRTRQIAWRKNNPEKAKEIDLKCTFGIDLNQYNELFSRQDGCCAICSKHQSLFKKALAVDHCHKTGKFRGLLCEWCNHGLGRFEDDPERLMLAAKYLKTAPAEIPGIVLSIKRAQEKAG